MLLSAQEVQDDKIACGKIDEDDESTVDCANERLCCERAMYY